MPIYRFFVPEAFQNKYLRLLNPQLLHQWQKVLRLKVGDEVILVNNQLQEAKAKIVNLTKDFAEVEIIAVTLNPREPKREVILYCALLKGEKFEWVVQKATEVGIKEIVPLLTRRTVKLNFRRERLEKIIQEAVEQAGRGIVPLLSNPIKLEEVVKLAQGNEINLFFDFSGEQFSSSLLKKKKKIGVFIGPEGGWAEDEVFLAKHNSFQLVSLGDLILRAETAALIASYLAVNF